MWRLNLVHYIIRVKVYTHTICEWWTLTLRIIVYNYVSRLRFGSFLESKPTLLISFHFRLSFSIFDFLISVFFKSLFPFSFTLLFGLTYYSIDYFLLQRSFLTWSPVQWMELVYSTLFLVCKMYQTSNKRWRRKIEFPWKG